MAKYYIPIYTPCFLECICIWTVLLYRKLKYGYAFRKIKLTQNKFAIVDYKKFDKLNQYSWFAVNAGYTFYAARSAYTENKKRIIIKMHRQIIGQKNKKLVDHINGNGLDNRKANLRPATPKQNSWNRRINKTKCSSKYIGVHKCKENNKWRAKIKDNGRIKHLGYFNSEIEAAKTYDRVAKKLRKEFSITNNL